MPDKYQEIDNFYTTTIYEKGAEIIRMLNKLVKDENFYKGFSNYISTYDGKAATIDQFVDKILEHNKEIDPKEFKVWYKQNGTPKVKFKRIWDQAEDGIRDALMSRGLGDVYKRQLLSILIISDPFSYIVVV